MFIVLAIIIVGVLLGTQIRSAHAPALFSKLLNIIIYILLLVMGISVGGNERIVSNLSTIGLNATIIALGAILGSITFAAIIYNYIFKTGEEERDER